MIQKNNQYLSVTSRTRSFRHVFIGLLLLTFSGSMFAQISVSIKNQTIREALRTIEQKSEYRFFFSNQLPDLNRKINLDLKNRTIEATMKMILNGTKLTYQQKENKQIVLAEIPATGNITSSDKLMKISGTVTDESGAAIIGANVQIKGTKIATISDVNGNFKIDAPANGTLAVSFIGYTSSETSINGREVFAISMKEKTKSLDEVVVIGYGTVKKRDVTGAVVSLKAADITAAPTSNVMEALQGKISGMDIVRPSGKVGGDVNILLRGSRSIYGDNSPLFIIDGIPGSYSQLNPSDIESVEVLKDASSTAIYGSAGSNGVVIITTKRGSEGKTNVTLDAYYGFSGKPHYFHGMTGDEWTTYQKEAYKYANGAYPADMSSILTDASKLEAFNNGKWIDWVDQLAGQSAINQKYNISVTGGNQRTKLFFSTSYDNQEGLLPNEKLNKYSLRLNADQELMPQLKIGVSSIINYTIQNNGAQNDFTKALTAFPLGTPYDENGNIVYQYANQEYTPLGDFIANQYVNQNRNTYVNANGYALYTPLKGLSLKSVVSATLNNSRLGQYWGAQATANRPTYAGTPHAEILNSYGYNYSWENILTYTKTIAEKHSITLTGVSSWAQNQSESNKAAGSGQTLDSWSFYRLTGATSLRVESDYSQTQKMSYAFRFNYSYLGRYLFSFSNRWDGVSWLSEGKKWDNFPAAALAWRISDESFMKSTNNWLSNLKLRLSYGVTGNSGGVTAYSTTTTPYPYSSAGITIDGKIAAFTQYTGTYGNKSLGWEKSKNANIGLDMGFLNGKIDASVEYFDTRTTGLLFKRTMPVTSGATGWGSPLVTWQNIAETSNRGVEFSINSHNIDTKRFKWNTNFSFSWSKEKIESLPTGNLISENLFVGQPIRSYYDYQYNGIWGSNTAAETLTAYGVKPGFIHINTVPKVAADGTSDNGVHKYSTADKMVLGHQNPDYILGLNNTFTYRQFDFSFFVMARIGQTIKSDLLGRYTAAKPGSVNQIAGADYWTENNQSAYFPIAGSGSEQSVMSALVYRDGSFAKIKNVTLGYSLPSQWINNLKMEKCRLYFTAYNPLVVVKDKQLQGTDPENNGSDSFPLYSQFVFGANISF